MKKRTLFLLLLSVGIYLFFYHIIPVPFVHNASFFWAFVGGIGAAACIFLAGYLSSKENEEGFDAQKIKKREILFIIPSVLIALFGSFVLAFHFDTREVDFIKKNPVIVDGTIIDGVSKTKKRSTTYELTVRYADSAGNSFTETIDATSDQWSKAGKGMAIKVVYERNNPNICKLLMNAEDAFQYMDKNKKLSPSLKNLSALMQTKDISKRLQLLGEAWQFDRNEDAISKQIYFNTISNDNILLSDNVNIYLNEKEQPQAYNTVLTEAKQNMKVVFDSTATNKRKGIMLENDSLRIRFQVYSKMQPLQSKYGPIGYSSKKVYCFGFAKKNIPIFLPGDTKSNDVGDQYDKLLDKLNNKN